MIEPGATSRQLFFVADLLPTVAGAVGLPLEPEAEAPLDGVDLWKGLRSGSVVDRPPIVITRSRSVAVIDGAWKLVQGEEGQEPPMLVQLLEDPSEERDLSGAEGERLQALLELVPGRKTKGERSSKRREGREKEPGKDKERSERSERKGE